MSLMNDDELRATLSRHDPAAGRQVEAASSPRARAHWERIMSTPVDQRVPASPATAPARLRRRLAVAITAAVLAAAGVGAAIAVRSGEPERAPEAARELALTLPDGGAAQSCAMFDVALLGQMPVAFQGTAVAVADTSVVLRVDRWFRGGEGGATTVRLSSPGSQVSETVEFTQGQAYLVSAQEGHVNVCGYTGPLTPELLGYFEKAFGTR
ncbi:hypothetical protein [Phytohabitans rumicis]|uniref:Uncharacterized protein n=1 Tax=Phytohabitans rumicis TaxID=1076125 RepID=A0A6V8LMX8_9ACTN|nr:hypothetical protein [Phytohabitans rumicis]GFJ94025.1 hypothetical protein Prum_076670 [Phytohabitans rumicis]